MIGHRNLEVLVIGGGLAGLAVGHYLARQRQRFLIVDAGQRIGDSWRARWDSLRLFTPRAINHLPGLPFPDGPDPFPTKDEMADYLESYATHFSLPIVPNTRVTRLVRDDDGFRADSAATAWHARQVVVATGAFDQPNTPVIASCLPAEVYQIHSSGYRNPTQVPLGPVLIVGAKESGGQIAEELSKDRQVYLAVGGSLLRPTPRWLRRSALAWQIGRIRNLYAQNNRLAWPFGTRFSVTDTSGLAKRGKVQLLGRAVGVEGNVMLFSDTKTLRVRSVIWATGYREDYSWIDLTLPNPIQRPEDRKQNIVPGLHFLGEDVLLMTVHWARHVAKQLGDSRGVHAVASSAN